MPVLQVKIKGSAGHKKFCAAFFLASWVRGKKEKFMKKSLESLILVLISFMFLSCSKVQASDVFGYVGGMFAHTDSYEIFWHDLRDSKTKEIINAEFVNEKSGAYVRRKLVACSTKSISLPCLDDFYLGAQENTVSKQQYSVQYLLDSVNKRLEIFLMDLQYVAVDNYMANVKRLDGAIGYMLAFPDEKENRWCYLCSRKNSFNVSRDDILEKCDMNVPLIWKEMESKDIGFFAGELADKNQAARPYYLIESKIYDGYVLICPQGMDFIFEVYEKKLFQ